MENAAYWLATLSTDSAHSPMASPGFSWCPGSAVLQDPFKPSEPVPLGKLLHITKFG